MDAGNVCPMTIHLIGQIKNRVRIASFLSPKTRIFHASWIKMHGYISDLSAIYEHMDMMISPMMCGTGMNIKTAEAMAYGVPLLATTHAARGTGSRELMHQHSNISELVDSLCALSNSGQELERLAEVSRKQFTYLNEQNKHALMTLLSHPKLCI